MVEESASPSGGRAYSVSELTRAIKSLLEDGIGMVAIEGEISNYRRQASGHQYFVLKDDSAQISCVLFKGRSYAVGGTKLAEGQQVRLTGELSVYAARGQYQVIVQKVQPQGTGSLYAQFEALKRKLHEEGLFDSAHKMALPGFPQSICILTSASGAAVRDMIDVAQRRAPWIELSVMPVRVQGSGAAEEMAAALQTLNTWHKEEVYQPDVLILGRGGGSIEDLWEFNREVLARAIFDSDIPVISAVGHETDFTIADFVADVRAPTPSAAAEIALPEKADLLNQIRSSGTAMRNCFHARLKLHTQQLLAYRPASIRRELARFIEQKEQQIDDLVDDLTRGACAKIDCCEKEWTRLRSSLALYNPKEAIALIRQQLAQAGRDITQGMKRGILDREKDMRQSASQLRLLGPEQTLARGFTLTLTESGEIIRSAKMPRPGKVIRTRFTDGELESTVSGR